MMTYQPRPERRPPEDEEERESIFPPTDEDEDDPIHPLAYWSIILLCVFETAAVFYGLYGLAWLIGQAFK